MLCYVLILLAFSELNSSKHVLCSPNLLISFRKLSKDESYYSEENVSKNEDPENTDIEKS